MNHVTRVGIALLLVASFALPGAAPAAPTEGRDEWTRVQIQLLRLEGPPSAERAVRRLALSSREILSHLESTLGARYAQPFRIVLIPPGGVGDSAIARIDETAPPWAAGYMLPSLRVGAVRIAQSSQYPYGTLESVLAHEATHMLLHDAVGRELPLWFEEGVATWQGRQWSSQDTWVYTRSLLTSGFPALAALDSSFHASVGEADLAYAASFSFVSWSVRRYGPDLVRTVLREMETHRFAMAWEIATGAPLAQAESSWRRDSLIRYRWIPLLATSTTMWLGITLIGIWAGFVKRARARAIRKRWEDEERAEAAAQSAGDATEDIEN